jgi:hypothetical protein
MKERAEIQENWEECFCLTCCEQGVIGQKKPEVSEYLWSHLKVQDEEGKEALSPKQVCHFTLWLH